MLHFKERTIQTRFQWKTSKRELQIFFSIVQHLQFLSTYKGKMAQPVNSQGANNEISFRHGKQFVKLFVWIPNNPLKGKAGDLIHSS